MILSRMILSSGPSRGRSRRTSSGVGCHSAACLLLPHVPKASLGTRNDTSPVLEDATVIRRLVPALGLMLLLGTALGLLTGPANEQIALLVARAEEPAAPADQVVYLGGNL